MMDELKELFRELKNPALLVALGAMICGVLILYNIQFKVKPPVKIVQVDYCVISYRGAAKDQFGVLHSGWVRGFGQCSELDRYENI